METKQRRSKTLVTLLAILVLLLFGIGGWYWSSKSKSTNQTADWKTYANEKYAYTIKYPKDWIIDNSILEAVTLNSPKNARIENKIKIGKMYSEGYMRDITLYYYDNLTAADGNNPKIYKTFTDLVYDIANSNQKEISFAGQKAYEFSEGGFGSYYVIVLEKDGHIYEILFGNREGKAGLDATDNQILSTFQFTP
ncbi:hypothetical protein HY373_02145 [Candidatus Berkelbacteria bacterium]|nr:hypothetical protein [Candidatus Berkelbacteria bacterium]